MIPIKFLIIFRELSITQCLRSHRHRQHLWHVLMLHPCTLNAALSRDPKHSPEREYGASLEAEVGRPRRKLAGSDIWDDSAYSLERSAEGRR